jgi:transcriptional regulator with XRE-family HTH domain
MATLALRLAEFMRANNLTNRAMGERAGVSNSVISDLLHGKEPRMETMVGLAHALGQPLWRIMEWAGYDVGLTAAAEDQARALASLAETNPEWSDLVSLLLAADTQDRRAVLNYLAVKSREQARQPTADPPDAPGPEA